jgi:hypothetical protein
MTETTALDVYGAGSDIKTLAERIKMCLPGGDRLSKNEALSLAQLSLAYNLNPFNGEVWCIPGKGTMVGIKGLRKAAHKQANYWTEFILLASEERAALCVPDSAIAYKCLIYRSDLIMQSAQAIKLMREAGMADAAERYAYKPTIGIGYWLPTEQTKMKGDQVARKRAEADGLKQSFDLPFASELGNGGTVGYVDVEWADAQPAINGPECRTDTFTTGLSETGTEEVAKDNPKVTAAPTPTSTPTPTQTRAPAAPSLPPNGKDNGNGQPAAPSTADPPARRPADLLKVVNGRIQVPYENIQHLAQAIKSMSGGPWRWPEFKDATGWQQAYDLAMAHARSKVQAVTASTAASSGGDAELDDFFPTEEEAPF